MVASLIFLARCLNALLAQQHLDLNLDTEILAAISAGYLTTLVTKRKTKTHSLHHFETTLEAEICTRLRND